eukprot:TRINITY_DN24892_c0_g1_i1.p1 TRINITY_DN24892_c0_g1~~TRINITY_DN24892_c0_g1_i1.p1  ORF type:complete len:444 (+),score=112.93 TRINITY_DN24892_c0_g1_i1:20-1351(+)
MEGECPLSKGGGENGVPVTVTVLDFMRKGDSLNVKLLINNGEDPNTRSKEGWGLLHGCCINDDPELIEFLLSKGAQLEMKDNGGYTPLHYAANFGSLECCKILLQHGADLEAKTIDTIYYISNIPIYSGGGRTPLMVAVTKNEGEVVRYLLGVGAEPCDVRDFDGRSAYDLACRDSKMRMPHVLCPLKTEHVYVNEPVNIPDKIAKRAALKNEKDLFEYRLKIKEKYKPLHPEVYSFDERALDESFLLCLKTMDFSSIMKEEHPGIYKFPILKPEFCDKLLEELEYFENYALNEMKILVRRPNSMNNYGLVLDDIGFVDHIDQFMKKYINPLRKLFFPQVEILTNHHCFLVRYKSGEDVNLALHKDDSELTLNVCLGKSFEGGTLCFYGTDKKKNEEKKCTVEHTKGIGLLHLGHHWHEANKILAGERSNLILWCRTRFRNLV